MNHPDRVQSITASARFREVQSAQAEYRSRLIDAWGIAPSSRILEVGCGQGDMTALLAEAVGPGGSVVAVDIADPSYGAPLTLQEATELIKATPAGDRIDFRFCCDLSDPGLNFPDAAFDDVIFAHSSWYFGSMDSLEAILRKVQPWARRLCFAEWDLEPHLISQAPHLLAVLIQGQVESFKEKSLANVRSPLPRGRLLDLLRHTGWQVASESSHRTDRLQDADWEIHQCLTHSLDEARALGLPPRLVTLLEGQVDLLRQIATPERNCPLDSYSIVAESPFNKGRSAR